MGKPKGGKVLVYSRDQTPFRSLSGTQKVVRTPTTPLEEAVNGEDFVPKEIITRRIQDICAKPDKGRPIFTTCI